MEEIIMYISGNKLNVIYDEESHELSSQVYQRYIKNNNEIKEKNKWKSKENEMFLFFGNEQEELSFVISGMCSCSRMNKFIYSTVTTESTSLYFKDYIDDVQTENLIFSDKNLSIKDPDFKNNKIIASVANSDSIESHIALFDITSSGYDFLTDGDTIDENPSWSKKNDNIIYYNCKGIGRDNNGNIRDYSPRCICKLNRLEGTVDDILSSEKYEFLKPKEDPYGNLYYIKIPYKSANKNSFKISDILLAPFRLLGALFGFLNIFTQRYSGKSLKTGGSNPAKANVKSEKDLFIEGNLINVENTLKENKNERYPGYVPGSWELHKLTLDGVDLCVKKGVLDYDITHDGDIVYSNGQYIMKINSSEETLIKKANLATRVIVARN